jgi:hypothetical protein
VAFFFFGLSAWAKDGKAKTITSIELMSKRLDLKCNILSPRDA